MDILSEENYNEIDAFMDDCYEFVEISSEELDMTYTYAMEGLNMVGLIESCRNDWYNYSPKNLYSYILNESQIRMNEEKNKHKLIIKFKYFFIGKS